MVDQTHFINNFKEIVGETPSHNLTLNGKDIHAGYGFKWSKIQLFNTMGYYPPVLRHYIKFGQYPE